METIELKSQTVAEFMGVEKHIDKLGQNRWNYHKNNVWLFDRGLQYHKLWEWLMPVIKKCKGISLQSEELAFDNGKPTTNLHIQELYEEIENGLLELDIDLTFEAVVNFIEYFRKID